MRISRLVALPLAVPRVPQTPGLGVDPDPDVLSRYRT